MKITVKKDNLQKALQKVSGIINTRTTLPVLSNVLFEACENKLKLTTTDLEMRISTVIDAEVEVNGSTTIPAKKMSSIVSKFNNDEVNISTDEKHHSTIICGTSNIKLLGLSGEDFPPVVDFDSVKNITFKQSVFAKIIEQIAYAVSLDDSRKVLHGILFSISENTFTAVATDGKRLALVEKVAENFSGEEGDTIVPLKTATEVKRILEKDGEVNISIGEKMAQFSTDDVCLTTKLIEGNYPNYRQVIPQNFSREIEIPRNDFIAKLELVAITLSDSSSFIKVVFNDNKLVLEGSSSSVGEGRDYLDINYTDELTEISFNPVFLADPFRHSTADNVIVRMNDGVSPVAIEGGEGFLYVIMPLRNK